MGRGRAVLIWVVGVLIGVLGVGERPVEAQRDGDGADSAIRLKQAVRRNDLEEMASALESVLASDDSGARLALRLLERGSVAQRAVTAGVLGRCARVEDVALMAMRLNRGTFRDERRWLVGSLGTRARAVVGSRPAVRSERLVTLTRLILPLVEDQDVEVRAAAIRALADTDTPASLLDALLTLTGTR